MISFTQRKIDKLRRKLASMRAGAANVKHDDLVNFAASLGRVRAKVGKEPTYVSIYLKRNPISIPGHTKLNKNTVKSVLDQLEEDLFLLEENSED